jgi:hypothetical protein
MEVKLRKSISTVALATLALAVVLLAGCVPNVVIRPNTPDIVLVAPEGSTSTTPEVPTGGADRHFVQPDDYFIMETALENQEFVDAAIGKMITPASEGTKFQGQFLRVLDGNNIWTKYYAKTRIATAEDLALGKEVFVLDTVDADNNYRAPESNAEARNTWWFKGKITDLSELYKNIVMLAGGYKVNRNALRVAM